MPHCVERSGHHGILACVGLGQCERARGGQIAADRFIEISARHRVVAEHGVHRRRSFASAHRIHERLAVAFGHDQQVIDRALRHGILERLAAIGDIHGFALLAQRVGYAAR